MKTKTERAAQLDAIAAQIERWINWHAADRGARDTPIMALPVPVWPTHTQFENWIEAIKDSAEKLRS